MVLKIEDYFFEIEDFRSEFYSKPRGLFGLILAKKVLYKKSIVAKINPSSTKGGGGIAAIGNRIIVAI